MTGFFPLSFFCYIKKKLEKLVHIFDLDDTLVKTNAKIHVFCNRTEELLHSLSPSDFNIFNRKDHHILNFQEFDDLEILLNGTLIEKNVNRLIKSHNSGIPVGIITARSHLASVLFFLKAKMIPVQNDMVYVVNDPEFPSTGDIPTRKRKAFETLVQRGFNSFVYYDDDEKNILMARNFAKESGIKMKAIKVDHE